MKKKHAFVPSLSDRLEDRVVLSSSTGSRIISAFHSFQKTLTAELKTAAGAARKNDIINQVNKLGNNLVQILGHNSQNDQLVRSQITGAPNPNGVAFSAGPAKGSLLASLLVKKPQIGPAVDRAEINILASRVR